MSKQLTNEEVDAFEDALREIENALETQGRAICAAEGGGTSWNDINCAIVHVQEAIHSAYRMRPL